MDPFLEGHLWPDVHHALAGEIRRRLTPLLAPRYVARLEIYRVEDENPEAEVGILYPVVGISSPRTHPVLQPVEVRIVTVEIRDAASNQLVTSIEILSPVNKRKPGVSQYHTARGGIASSAPALTSSRSISFAEGTGSSRHIRGCLLRLTSSR